MSRNLKVALTLRASVDQFGRAIKQASSDFSSAMQGMGGAAAQAGGKVDAALGSMGMRRHAEIEADIRKIERAYRDMAKSGELSTRELAQAKLRMQDRVRELRKETNGWGESLGKIKTELSIAGGAVYGLVRSMSAAARESSQFKTALAEVSTLLDDVGQMDALRGGVEQLAREFGGDVVSNSKALYDIISAGASDSATAVDTLRVANELAMGGVTDVSTAADGLTSVMNAYGEAAGGAADVSDAFFTAVKAGKTTVAELAGSIGQVAPIASEAGVSLDELLASVASLTKGGVATSQAMTQVRGALTGVIKPTDDAKKLAGELGLEFSAAALKSKGLAGFLAEVAQATGGNVEQMSRLFGSVEGLGAVLSLTGKGAADFADTLAAMGEKAGNTEAAVAKMLDTPAVRAARFEQSMAAVRRSFGDAITALSPLLDGLAGLVNTFNDLNPTLRTSAAGLAALAGTVAIAAPAIKSLAVAFGILRTGLVMATTARLSDTAATTAHTTATKANTKALGMLSIAMRAVPWVAAGAAILYAGKALWDWKTAADEAAAAAERADQAEAKLQARFRQLSDETGTAITNIQQYNQAVRDGIIIFDESTRTMRAAAAVMDDELNAAMRETADQQARINYQLGRAPISEQAKAIVDLGLATREWVNQLSAIDHTAEDAQKQIADLLATAQTGDTIEMAGLLSALDEIKAKTPELAALIEKQLIGTIEKLDSQSLTAFSASLRAAFDAGSISAEQFATHAQTVVSTSARQLGVDLDEALGRVTPGTQSAIENITAMAGIMESAGYTSEEVGTVIAKALGGAFKQARTDADRAALKGVLEDLGKQGQLTGKQMQGLQQDYTQVNDSQQQHIKGLQNIGKVGGNVWEENRKQIKQQQQVEKELQDERDSNTANFMAAWAAHWNAIRNAYYAMSDTMGEFYDSTLEKNAGIGLSFAQLHRNLSLQMEGMERLYNDQMSQAENMRDEIARLSQDSVGLDRIARMSVDSMHMLGEETLAPLRQAITDARREMEALVDSAANTLSSVEDDLDRIRGNEEAIRQRHFEQRRTDVEAQLAEARAQGNREAVADLEKALRLLQELEREEQKQREGRRRDKESRDSSRTDTTTTPTPTRTTEVIELRVGNRTATVPADAREDVLGVINEAMRLSS